jgi:transcriptional regulator with XRE-family HTH domain
LFTGRHLEPVLGRIRPLSERDRHFCSHHEEEFLFVLKGGVEFRCRTPDGLRREELSRGDCLYFRSDLPHCLASLEADPAETVHVLAAPSAPAESGFDWATWGASAVIEDNGASSAACAFGRKLRALRETRGWSVDQLARKVELGERQLQRIERGERAAPLDVVLRLARAFGKPFSELVTEPSGAGPHYFIQRSSEIARLPSRTRRTPVERPDAPRSKTCQPLASGFPARHMYPYFIRLLNVDMETLTFHEHHGHEFIYVLDGELELRTYAGDGLVTEMLLPGDCCYLDSTVPHLVRGQTRNPYSETSAEVIDVFWSPLGETYLFT